MNARVRKKLIQVARGRAHLMSFQNLIYEAELGLNLDNPHEKSMLTEVIDEISEREHTAGRPLLSALVRIKGQKNQGDNFFRLCERLGYGNWKELKRNSKFVESQREACRQFWQDKKNFTSYL
ncbi:hypothetical protein CLV24_10547 [Pontibacter ummariensis]|uniref:Uncharacterized protein n=2 Tax=Pontibacter ummariensis TaxID=1610492 RepID=A0A239E1F7_9BACT|nr:hypothetical protein CLV24_10547 [Pontibacter ummariensis]SNS37714.1 hypothetical protein SAMN06296052_105204 [Pontibacter ummariensis]